MQQYLPLAVLKLSLSCHLYHLQMEVATVLTACGIETQPYQLRMAKLFSLQQYLPLAVLKLSNFPCLILVKTWLQQYLPLAVLKPFALLCSRVFGLWLQQYLPLAVLKHYNIGDNAIFSCNVATVLTACGIETIKISFAFATTFVACCNSTYRLRY